MPSAETALASTWFGLARCRDCGTGVTIGECPPGLYETGAYGGGRPRGHALATPLLSAFDRRRLQLLRPLAPPPARLLDIGAGRGRFVNAALRAGYLARGIEPSDRGIAAAAAIGAPVEQVGIAEARIGPGEIEAATLWHVLEHLDDPARALTAIAGWTARGGALLVGVPNLASLQARIGGERWYHLDVPRHRVHFTPAGITALLHATGFEPIRTTHLLAEHNPFGMWQSLVNRTGGEPSYLYNLLKRNAPLTAAGLARTGLALPLIPVAVLAEAAAGLARRGGTIAVLARRVY